MMSDTGKIRMGPALNSIGGVPSGQAIPGRSARVDDSQLIREAQLGNTAAFEDFVLSALFTPGSTASLPISASIICARGILAAAI